MVTTAGSEAITFALAATLDPGDEVLIPEPLYANYLGFAALLGVRVIPITCRVEDGYHLPSREVIAKKITPRTRAILFCNPGNPTGTVLRGSELEMLVSLALKHHELFLIADEVYREFCRQPRHPEPSRIPRWPSRDPCRFISKRYSACAYISSGHRNTDVLAGVCAALGTSNPRSARSSARPLPADYIPGSAEYTHRRTSVGLAHPGDPQSRAGRSRHGAVAAAVHHLDARVFRSRCTTPANGHATPGGRGRTQVACVRTRAHAPMAIVERGLAVYRVGHVTSGPAVLRPPPRPAPPAVTLCLCCRCWPCCGSFHHASGRRTKRVPVATAVLTRRPRGRGVLAIWRASPMVASCRPASRCCRDDALLRTRTARRAHPTVPAGAAGVHAAPADAHATAGASARVAAGTPAYPERATSGRVPAVPRHAPR